MENTRLNIDENLEDSFFTLFDANKSTLSPITQKMKLIEGLKSNCFAVDSYIEGYLEEWSL